MKNKTNKKIKLDFIIPGVTVVTRRSFDFWQKTISIICLVSLVMVWSIYPIPKAKAAGLSVAVALESPAVGDNDDQITVTFTPETDLTNDSSISIYLGETSSGDPFTDGDTDQSLSDISCVQNTTTWTGQAQTDASATVPMRYYVEVDAVGTGSGEVVCTIGSSATDAPTNPAGADGYSIAVVTENDSGAGIAYVGNANVVNVSVAVLPNLSLTIGDAGTNCSTTGGGVTSCNLGIATTAAVSTGNYDVHVGSNSASGVHLYVKDNGNLLNGGDDINDTGTSTPVVAGTEGYGIAVAAGTGYTEQAPFNSDDNPITTSNQEVASTSAPIANTVDVDVTHRVGIDSTTKALTYTTQVTWTATAAF